MEDKQTYDIELDEESKQVKKVPEKTKAEGIPWEELKFKANAKEFAKAMRDNGLLTYQDVRTNAQMVVRLLQAHYKVDLGAILAFAKEHEEVD